MLSSFFFSDDIVPAWRPTLLVAVVVWQPGLLPWLRSWPKVLLIFVVV
jgi:hypothetical protein